jgi:hypothetical protein
MRNNEKQQTEVHGHAGILGAFKTIYQFLYPYDLDLCTNAGLA